MIAPMETSRKSGARKYRVLFLLPLLAGGGAERVSITLLRGLDRDAFDLHLGLACGGNAYRDMIPPDVSVHDLSASHVRSALPGLRRLIRAIRPDTVFSTLDHMNLAVMLLRPSLPSSIRFVIRPSNTLFESCKLFRWPSLIMFLYKRLYPRADCIVCQSDFMRDEMRQLLGVSARARRIYNPVDATAVREQAGRGGNPFAGLGPGPHVVTAGRLVRSKGIDGIIARLPGWLKTHPGLRLWILGEGDEEHALRQQARRLDVLDRIHFPGFQANPNRWFRHADLFVLASHYEGLPNVLLEALAAGCPAVATASAGGVPEVARLVGDKQCMLVDELPPAFPSLASDTQSPPDLTSFLVENVVADFANTLTGGER